MTARSCGWGVAALAWALQPTHSHLVRHRHVVSPDNEREALDGFDGFLNGSLPSVTPSVVLVKTHKTGSSTLANILHRLGDVRDSKFLVPMDTDIYLGWPGNFPGVVQSETAASFDVIANHAVYNHARMQWFMRSPPVFVTLLREPGEQAVSAYNYFSGAEGVDWDRHVTWLETEAAPALTDSQSALYLNPQAHDLGWYEYVGQSRDFDQDRTKIDEWITKLDGDFVGQGLAILSEHFDAGLVLLQRLLGCDLRELRYMRLKTAEGKKEPSKEELERLINVSAVDVALYTHFEAAYSKQWLAGNVSQQEADLARLQTYNQGLQEACGDSENPTPSAGCPRAVITDSPGYTCFLKKKQGLTCVEGASPSFASMEA